MPIQLKETIQSSTSILAPFLRLLDICGKFAPRLDGWKCVVMGQHILKAHLRRIFKEMFSLNRQVALAFWKCEVHPMPVDPWWWDLAKAIHAFWKVVALTVTYSFQGAAICTTSRVPGWISFLALFRFNYSFPCCPHHWGTCAKRSYYNLLWAGWWSCVLTTLHERSTRSLPETWEFIMFI
jgi:hypothetical protein